jgi:peptidoglycan hydrolase CwlO-like protein
MTKTELQDRVSTLLKDNERLAIDTCDAKRAYEYKQKEVDQLEQEMTWMEEEAEDMEQDLTVVQFERNVVVAYLEDRLAKISEEAWSEYEYEEEDDESS